MKHSLVGPILGGHFVPQVGVEHAHESSYTYVHHTSQ